jgi:hypothetical protein
METCKNHINKYIQLINIDEKLITNQQLMANSFNDYFLSVADKITNNIKNDKTLFSCNHPIHCLHKNFKLPCSNVKIKYTTPKEIEKIIKSLKTKISHGYDGIHMEILKVSTPFFTSIPKSCTDFQPDRPCWVGQQKKLQTSSIYDCTN